MSIVLIAAALVAAYLIYRRRKSAGEGAAGESTPALDRWIADVLEIELAEGALGMRASTPEERRKLAKSLRGDPDPDVVSRIEDKVRTVEVEYVKYDHETDTEVTLRVRYEDGKAGTATKRLALTDVPEDVRTDLTRAGSTRAFRTWVFPWSRARAL